MAISVQAERTVRRKLWALVVVSIVVQLGLAAVTEGYGYDVGCFQSWAMHVASVGPAEFYAPDYFCDYPPGYILMLWLPGKVLTLLPYAVQQVLRRVILALWPALATALCGPVVYNFARRYTTADWALRCAGAAMLCPALLFNTGAWGQIDGVFSLVMLICFALIEQQRWLAGALCFGIALAIKPQALLAGPALAVCFLLPILFAKNTSARWKAVGTGVAGALTALLPVVVCGLPFWGFSGVLQGLLEKYVTTTSSYPYATINAANLMAFMGGEWVPQTEMVYWFQIPLISWQNLGVLLVSALTVWAVIWSLKMQKQGKFSPLLLAAVYTIGVFTVSHRMHERYLILGAVLLIAAAARFENKHMLGISWGLALTSLLNMALVYTTVGTDDEFLRSATHAFMLRSVGLMETILFVLLLRECWQMCSSVAPILQQHQQRRESAATTEKKTTVMPAWTKREVLSLVGLTAIVAVVSFTYLGDFTAPQTLVDTNGEKTAQYTIQTQGDAQEIWVYSGISSHNNGKLTITDANGTVQVETDLNHSSTFKWNRYSLADARAPYTVSIQNGQVVELSFRDAAGAPLAVNSEQDCALIDEQQLVPEKISQLSSFYFDEIYHARTGYEHLHKMPVYETTHPPMGKNFIAMGIALFGMTGFGWRFAGTLFGVLMVPALYDLVRRLTRKPWLSWFAAALFALDFMRFSQSRLATIDSYVVLFIILGADMMLWYCHSVLERGVAKSLLPMALGGVAFGFGCASKWTGLYAGAGLAILYFGVLWQRACLLKKQPGGSARLKKEIAIALGGGVLFYVVIPFGIYLAGYLPYVMRDPSFGLQQWWDCQNSMYWYHSTLDATHPFASEWYSWLLDARPVWYYNGSGLPEGMVASIAGFVSPVLIVVGVSAWVAMAYRQLVGDGSPAGGALIVVTLSSLLPWVLVTRCTFLYHFFPCVPMLAAAAALWLSRLEDKGQGRKAKRFATGILLAALLLFVWFYPVLAGLPIPKWLAASMRWLPSWGFYIL